MKTFGIALMMGLLAVSTAQAGWLFGETEEEKDARIAKHVAEVLREPDRLIAEATDAFEANDIEEAVRKFTEARDKILEIEAGEDTSGSAFSAMRLKKFHCVSMLDTLALMRSEVMDVRQNVTDTTELEARLEQERAAELKKLKALEEKQKVSRPPTLEEQLETAEANLAAAKATLATATADAEAARAEVKAGEERFKTAAKAYSEADAAAFVARHNATKAPNDKALAEASAEARKVLRETKATREAARAEQQQIKARAEKAETALAAAQVGVTQAEATAKDLRETIEEEEAARREAEAEEQKRLEAEEILRRQAAAAAEAKARAEAQALRERAAQLEKERALKAEAEAKAKAEADAKAKAEAERQAAEAAAKAAQEAAAAKAAEEQARTAEIEWCNELWRLKQIDQLEARVATAAARWPEAPEFLVLLARIRLLQTRYDDALEITALIPATGETGKQARMVAAGVYVAKKQPLEAMKILEAVIADAPKDPAPCLNMATVLLQLPQIDPKGDLAAEYYRKSVELGGKRSLSLERRLRME